MFRVGVVLLFISAVINCLFLILEILAKEILNILRHWFNSLYV